MGSILLHYLEEGTFFENRRSTNVHDIKWKSPTAVLEIKISCACVINRLVNISIQIFRSKYVRIRLQTSTSSFYKNSVKTTVNFGSYRKHNTWNFFNLNGNLPMNDKIRAAQRSGSKPVTLEAFSGKSASSWHSVPQVFTKAQIAANI